MRDWILDRAYIAAKLDTYAPHFFAFLLCFTLFLLLLAVAALAGRAITVR